MSLTDQQQDAVIRRDVSVVLSSGAGCGKTHVLTQRYLSHLTDDGAEVSQIVAITFTDRAARQMRLRIRQAVIAHLRAATDDDDVARWEQHLRGLETAQISTIHAFCANLLRQFAVEAGLDPRFEVLEDYLSANLETEALTGSLQNLLTADTGAGEDLRELVLLYGWRPMLDGVRHLLRDHEPALQRQWLQQSNAEIEQVWRDYVKTDLLPTYVTFLTQANAKISQCLGLLRTTPCKGPKMAANVQNVLSGMAALTSSDNVIETVKEIIQAARVGNTERAGAWPSPEIYNAVKKALEDFRNEIRQRMTMFLEEPDDLTDAIETGKRFLRVTAEAARAYQQLKRRHGVVDFQDLLVRARDLLRDHAGVRERLQHRFRFLLIDELQDTDPVQMEFIESLAGAGKTAGKLFAVGDHSQSIYRFRGADVQLFQDLRRDMPARGQLDLTLNFRSQPAILKFVNLLFGPGPSAGLEDYEALEPHHHQLNEGSCIEFLWSPGNGANATESRQIEADWIARRIAEMIHTEEKLVAERTRDGNHLRAVRPGDVVLLFRSMSNVEIYEAALRRCGLHYYLVGGRAFFAQQEIYDLLNLLRTLENPQDSVSLAGTLRSPFCCLSDEALFVLSRHAGGLWAGLQDKRQLLKLPADQRERGQRAQTHLHRWRGLKNRLHIARLLGEILADSGYDAAMQFEILGDRKLANLWKLIDMARSFDRSGLFGLAEFIRRLSDLVTTQPREEQAATQPENADVVWLMTIHQAKGLEFPIVILPDVAAAVGGGQYPLAQWQRRLGCVARPPKEEPPPFTDFGQRMWLAGEAVADWREDLRTFYVACTRAQDYLLLSACLPDQVSAQSPWIPALAQRFDLHSGTCLVPDTEAGKIPTIRMTRERPAACGEEAKPQAAACGLASSPPPNAANIFDPLVEPQPSAFQWDAEDGSDRSLWPTP